MSREELYVIMADYIKKHSGIVYSQENFFQLDARINLLKKQLGFVNDLDLCQSLKGKVSPEMHMMVIDAATNNETFFFRDTKLWTTLQKQILPRILNSGKQNLRVWSLACSTGQEIYSFLMLWDKLKGSEKMQLSADASDISPRVLKRAELGCYSQLEVQRGLPITDLTYYFTPDENMNWKIRADFPKMIKFNEFNMLTDSFPISQYDIIFCRNVLIYQEVEHRKEIIRKVSDVLSPNGILILGNSENLIGVSDDFTTEVIDGVVFNIKNSFVKKAAG